MDVPGANVPFAVDEGGGQRMGINRILLVPDRFRSGLGMEPDVPATRNALSSPGLSAPP